MKHILLDIENFKMIQFWILFHIDKFVLIILADLIIRHIQKVYRVVSNYVVTITSCHCFVERSVLFLLGENFLETIR